MHSPKNITPGYWWIVGRFEFEIVKVLDNKKFLRFSRYPDSSVYYDINYSYSFLFISPISEPFPNILKLKQDLDLPESATTSEMYLKIIKNSKVEIAIEEHPNLEPKQTYQGTEYATFTNDHSLLKPQN